MKGNTRVDQVLVTGSKISTSLDGLGAVPPLPITYIRLQKLSARVSPVGSAVCGDNRGYGIPLRVISKGVSYR